MPSSVERKTIEAAFSAYREHQDKGDWNAWVDLFFRGLLLPRVILGRTDHGPREFARVRRRMAESHESARLSGDRRQSPRMRVERAKRPDARDSPFPSGYRAPCLRLERPDLRVRRMVRRRSRGFRWRHRRFELIRGPGGRTRWLGSCRGSGQARPGLSGDEPSTIVTGRPLHNIRQDLPRLCLLSTGAEVAPGPSHSGLT